MNRAPTDAEYEARKRLAPLKALSRNAWNWGLFDFLKVMGWEDTEHARQRFRTFQTAAREIALLDDDVLLKLCQE